MATASDRPVRPRRSLLFMPGSNQRALEKGKTVAADGLIFDLEDGVAPEAKDEARQRIGEALGSGAYGRRELVVRINGLDSAWIDADIEAMASAGADALLLPKIDDAGQVAEVAGRMDKAGAPQATAIWCMIETARGVLNATEIAAASGRLGALVMGAGDLTKDLHALHTPDRVALLTSIGLCILAARANGLAVLDSPFFDLSDDEGFLAACAQGRAMGFDGKTLIHPKTIDGANRAFGASADEIGHARRIIDAHGEALARGQGVTLLDGKLVEGLHVAEAERLIELADAIAELEDTAAG